VLDNLGMDNIQFGRNAPYAIEVMTTMEAKKDYPCVWKTAQNMFPMMLEEDLARVVSLVTDTCPHCWETQRGCQCWNDE
jgi:hypothetical protein